MTELRVVSVTGLALVQDGGRPGRMHEGIPPGGALCPEMLAAANLAAGNLAGAPAIEHYGPLVVASSAPLPAATSDGVLLLDRDVRLAPRVARVAYLAVAGGIDVRPALGGRGTLLVARLGGLEGRPLRAGDLLPVGASHGAPSPQPVPPDPGGDIEVVVGPDPGDVATLLASTYTVSPVGDRTGIRLSGPAVRATAPTGTSAPMVRGAIQTTPSGELIVMGPDHPTTGGYPVVAVVALAQVGRLLAARPGTAIRFVSVDR